MATIYEVSKLAGVSLATVSRVMNGSGRVAEKTRNRVLAAIQELDYRPNAMARSLASNRSNCVGVLVPEMHGPIFGTMLSEIELELRREGKFTMFTAGHSDAEKEAAGIRFLIERSCDALILHVEALDNDFLLELSRGEIPFVLLNRRIPGLEDRCITLDNEKGGYEATNMLLEMGHTSIAYISGPLAWSDANARLQGHKRAMREHNVAFDERLLVEGDYHEIGGSNAMTQLLQQGIPFTAVVCANDEMAAGAMDMARARGMAIPEEVSIVGFDNAPLGRYLYPKLSTVTNPVGEMGKMAATWVLASVYDTPGGEIRHVFEPRLVQRASAGPRMRRR